MVSKIKASDTRKTMSQKMRASGPSSSRGLAPIPFRSLARSAAFSPLLILLIAAFCAQEPGIAVVSCRSSSGGAGSSGGVDRPERRPKCERRAAAGGSDLSDSRSAARADDGAAPVVRKDDGAAPVVRKGRNARVFPIEVRRAPFGFFFAF